MQLSSSLKCFLQKKMETDFSRLLSVAERTTGLFFSYEINLTLRSFISLFFFVLQLHSKTRHTLSPLLNFLFHFDNFSSSSCFSAQRLHDLGDESKSLPLWRQVCPYALLCNLFIKHLFVDGLQINFCFFMAGRA